MKKVALVGKLVAVASTLLLAGSLFAQAPNTVQIRNIMYNGSGCPIGSVGQNIAPDFKAFTLTFSDYIAEIGPGIPLSDARKNCQLTLDMYFPQGWQFAIATFDYRGYVSLDRRVQATQSSAYYFQGQGQTGRFSTNFSGPVDRDYQFRDTIGLTSLVWSPCGATRALNINTQVRLNNRSNPNGSGLITTDSIDGQIIHKYGLQWRRC